MPTARILPFKNFSQFGGSKRRGRRRRRRSRRGGSFFSTIKSVLNKAHGIAKLPGMKNVVSSGRKFLADRNAKTGTDLINSMRPVIAQFRRSRRGGRIKGLA